MINDHCGRRQTVRLRRIYIYMYIYIYICVYSFSLSLSPSAVVLVYPKGLTLRQRLGTGEGTCKIDSDSVGSCIQLPQRTQTVTARLLDAGH